jgi:hypothetical protein
MTIDQEIIDAIPSEFQALRDKITNLEKLHEKQLNQPAVLTMPYWGFISIENISNEKSIFTTPNRGYQLVRVNPEYADPSREKWKPQYMWVSWSVSQEDFYPANTVALDKMIRESFDFDKLGEMLLK